MISAKVLADSINQYGNRITTFEVCAHRFILAEINTHRVFSRNWRSSRAVPIAKLVKEVRTNPAMPVEWGSNKPGMQAGEPLSGYEGEYATRWWVGAAKEAALAAENLADLGVHKQVANRLLEPFLYVYGVITATEWDNFYNLRCHPDAQPEIRVLAEAMRDAQNASTPNELIPGQWHLPYIPDPHNLDWKDKESSLKVFRVSAARCARVSYKLFDGAASSTEADVQLAASLMKSGHWSPFEHQATPDFKQYFENPRWSRGQKHRNFVGWVQYRAIEDAPLFL